MPTPSHARSLEREDLSQLEWCQPQEELVLLLLQSQRKSYNSPVFKMFTHNLLERPRPEVTSLRPPSTAYKIHSKFLPLIFGANHKLRSIHSSYTASGSVKDKNKNKKRNHKEQKAQKDHLEEDQEIIDCDIFFGLIIKILFNFNCIFFSKYLSK